MSALGSSVVVAVDASDASRRAFDLALDLFVPGTHQMTIVVVASKDDAIVDECCASAGISVKALKSGTDFAALAAFETVFLQSTTELSDFVAVCKGEAERRGFLVFVRVLLGTKPGPAIEKFIEHSDAEIVALVLGARGKGKQAVATTPRAEGALEIPLGSVASHLVEHVRVPVLLVKTPLHTPDARRTFCFAIENSKAGLEGSLSAASRMLEHTRRGDAVVFLSVQSIEHASGDNPDQWEHRQRQDRVLQFCDSVRATGVACANEIRIGDDPAAEILDYCQGSRIDVLCMGHRSRGLLSRVFSLGSVAKGCIKASVAAIWILKS